MRNIKINIICMHDKPILFFFEIIHDIKENQIRADIILNPVIGYLQSSFNPAFLMYELLGQGITIITSTSNITFLNLNMNVIFMKNTSISPLNIFRTCSLTISISVNSNFLILTFIAQPVTLYTLYNRFCRC